MLARARARRQGALHRAEPGRALGTAGRHALRLWPALFAVPARRPARQARFSARATLRGAVPTAIGSPLLAEDRPGLGTAWTQHIGHFQWRRPDRGSGKGDRPNAAARAARGGIPPVADSRRAEDPRAQAGSCPVPEFRAQTVAPHSIS